jgi:hypothetical protein
MQSLQLLWEITNSLTQQDIKEVYRSFETRGPKAMKSDPAKLFRALQDTNIYNEEKISITWRRQFGEKKKPERAFYDATYILKNILLDSLVKSNRQFIGGNTERLLNHAEIYISKGYYSEAYKTLELALVESDHCTMPYFKNMILQRMVFLQQFVGAGNMDANREALLKQCADATEHLLEFNKVYQFNHKVSSLLKRTAIMKQDADIQILNELMADPILYTDITKLNHAAQLHLAKSKAWIYGLLVETEKQYYAQAELCKLLQKNEQEHLNTTIAPVYLTEFCDASLFAAHMNNKQESFTYADYVLQHIPQNSPYTILFETYPVLLKAFACYIAGELSEMITFLHLVHAPLLHNIEKIPPNVSDNMRMIMLKCWLSAKEFEKIKLWNYTLKEKRPFLRLDCYFVSQLIYLCALYEQSKISLNKNTIRLHSSYAKYAIELQKLKIAGKQFPLETAIAETFHLLIDSSDTSYHANLLQALHKKLIRLEAKQSAHQKRFYLMFDLKKWIGEQLLKFK